MKKTSKALASTAAVCLVLSSTSVFAAETSVAPERLAGQGRVNTAIKIAEEGFKNNEWKSKGTAILSAAADANLVDSLAVAPLSYQLKAPILLNDAKDSINADTLATLKANKVTKVYIATGEGVITDKAKAQLEKEGMTVVRLGGKDRFQTANNILKAFKENGGNTKNVAFVSGTTGLADALSVAPQAAAKGMPILLTNGKDAVATDLAEIAKAADKVYAIGGQGVISNDLLEKLNNATRLGGNTRYETNAAVIKEFAGDKAFSKIYVGSGQNSHLVDSLTGSVLAAQTGSPIVLADGSVVDATKEALKGKIDDKTKAVALGGEAVVSDELVKEVVTVEKVEAPEVVAAEKAVKAYETAKIGTAEEITAAKALKAPAVKAVEAVKDAAKKEALNARIAAQDKAIVAAEAKLQLSVESVSAINNAQLKVTFNKEVDKTTAEDLANYTLTTTGSAVLTGGKATLQADGKTVVLDLATAANNQEKVKLEIKDIRDKDAKKLEKITKEVEFFDVTLPVAEKVELTGTKTLKVTMSEPVKAAQASAVIKIDGGKYSAPALAVGTGINRNEITLTLPATLPAGEHTLTIEGIVDYANFASASKDLTFTYSVDKTAPTVSIKEIKSDAKTVVLKFNKDIDSTKFVNNAQVEFSHTYKGQNKVTGTAVTKVSDSEYTVAFTNPLAPGTSSIFVDYVSGTTDAQKVKDLFGNIFELPVTLKATVEADTVAPAVEKVEATKANKIEVTFSEDVNAADAQSIANYKLTNAKNEIISVQSVSYVAADKKATITTSSDMKAGDYKLEIKNITDKAVVANKMTTVVKDLTVADKVAPKVDTVVYDAKNKKVIVKFDKDMAQTGLTDLANYGLSVDGTATDFPAGTVASIKDSKTVEITLGKDIDGLDGVGTSDKLQISGSLKDNVGNAIGGISTTKDIAAANTVAPKVVADSAKFIDKETITFEVDTELKAINKSITNYIQYDGTDVAEASYVNQGNKALVTVKVASSKVLTDTSSTGINKNLVIAANALESVFGGKTAGETVLAANIEDKVAPFITAAPAGVVVKDTDGNGQIDTVDVKFSEKVLAGSIQASDFSVSDGYTVKSVVSVAGDTVTLKLNESGTPDTGATPTVTITGEIEDLKGNKTSTSDAVVGDDKVAPVGVALSSTQANSGIYAAGDKITLVFSEPVKVEDITTTNLVLAKGTGSNATPKWDDSAIAAKDPVSGYATTFEITLANGTSTLSLETGNTITIAKAKVTDKATVANTAANDVVFTLK